MVAKIDPDKCNGCETCIDACPMEAISMEGELAVVDEDECTDCGVCEDECSEEAIEVE